MGREVRRVPGDWQHPKRDGGQFVPLHDGYESDKAEFLKILEEDGYEEAVGYFGGAPNPEDYMPDWPEAERTHLMMYEDTTEGTPISPAFEKPEDLARWLADNNASAFGSMTATYEEWLATIGVGYSIGAVMDSEGWRSGVEENARPPRQGSAGVGRSVSKKNTTPTREDRG